MIFWAELSLARLRLHDTQYVKKDTNLALGMCPHVVSSKKKPDLRLTLFPLLRFFTRLGVFRDRLGFWVFFRENWSFLKTTGFFLLKRAKSGVFGAKRGIFFWLMFFVGNCPLPPVVSMLKTEKDGENL